MYSSHWKPAGVSEMMSSVNLYVSISGEYQTLGGHSCWPSKQLGAPTTSLGVPGSTVDKPGSTVDKPGSAGDMSGSTSNHRRAVQEKQHLLSERCWCAWKSELLLMVQWFLKLINSVCILIYVSMHLYSYPSTHGISGLAADGAWEQFKVRLKIMIEWIHRYTPGR